MAMGGFFKGEKKKAKKHTEKKNIQVSQPYMPPQVEIIGKGKKDKYT